MIHRRLANFFNFFMFTASGSLVALGMASLLEVLNNPETGLLMAILGGILGAAWGTYLITKRNRRYPARPRR